MIRRFWPLLVTAFLVGGLFRLYTDTGIGFYRMFGTLGIVFLGALASRIVVTAQLEDGERELKEAVADLPDTCDVWRLTRQGADRAVVGPAGAVVLLTSNVAQYARGLGLRRHFHALRDRMEQAVELVHSKLTPAAQADSAVAEGEGASARKVYRSVVFLRRVPRPDERAWLAAAGIEAVAPEEVSSYLRARVLGEGAVAEHSSDEAPVGAPEGV